MVNEVLGGTTALIWLIPYDKSCSSLSVLRLDKNSITYDSIVYPSLTTVPATLKVAVCPVAKTIGPLLNNF
jgi:hypothetical protein